MVVGMGMGIGMEAHARLLEQRRRIAMRMVDRGMAATEIADIVEVGARTVRAWRRLYEAGGWEALRAKPHYGPRCKLDDEQKQGLISLLHESPKAYGYGAMLWSTRLVARLIQDRFGVAYSHNHVGVILHELGYSWQMPARQARERDEQKIAHWREQTWPTIVAERRERLATLAFVDEAGYSMIPTLKKQWAPRGQTPVVKHRNRWHRKVSVIGALTVTPGETGDDGEPGLSLQWHPGGHVTQSKVVEFLKALVHEYGETLDIIWDNLSSHGGKEVTALLQEHPGVRLHRLPPYAADLNPIEGVWSLTKYHRMANHQIDDLDTLHAAALSATADVAEQPHLLRSCIAHAGLADALWPSGCQ